MPFADAFDSGRPALRGTSVGLAGSHGRRAAPSFSSIEGTFGTLYIAVMIARLVGLHSLRPTDDASPKE
jgi:hypothetical protein